MACSRVKITFTYYSPLSHIHPPTTTQTNSPPTHTHIYVHSLQVSITQYEHFVQWLTYSTNDVSMFSDTGRDISPMLLRNYILMSVDGKGMNSRRDRFIISMTGNVHIT
jgi:hypothetical protein